MSSLENVKLILDLFNCNETEEQLINLYLSRAANFVKNYCQIIDIPENLTSVIEDIAVIKYQLRGVEGIKSEGKGSLSESYIDSLPLDIIQQLDAHKDDRMVDIV
ncbi:phage head-tail connector protein [Priestia koreensis]|uniref:Phage gp6-like head-tail connector protein n=1 Tax=Priestia koreensis TaxID=284581 RepID=A0A0M0L6V4_9BACI|nr:phage head-tail connector protein [Priestia koreensis]KOO46398.1 hypothetical protein AMD01_11220 [Priestia koreensis]